MNNLARFRRLVAWAAGTTFVLIVIGGVVRVSDSGLGCGAAGSGTHGWPLCGGRVVPLVKSTMIVEYTHRIAAAVVVALLVALAWIALRSLAEYPRLVRGSLVACGLVAVQAALGGLTVEHGLEEALVATHLGVAMLLIGILLGLWVEARRAEGSAVPPRSDRATRLLASGAALLVLATIVAGGVVAGTEKHGTTVAKKVEGAHMACGFEFPACNGSVLPFGRHRLIDIQLVHRSLMALTVIAVLAFALVAWRRRVGGWLPLLLVVLLAAQVVLGAMNVWLGEHAELVVGHLTLGTLLWTTAAGAALSLTLREARHVHERGPTIEAVSRA